MSPGVSGGLQQSGGQPEGSGGSIVDDGDDGSVALIAAEVCDDGLQQSGLLGEDGAGGCQWQLLRQLQSIGHGADHECEVLSGGGDDPAGDGVSVMGVSEGEGCEFSDECAGNFGGVDAGDEFRGGADLQLFADGR